MADKENDRADINSLREHLSPTRSSLKLKVPVMWYICKQITQGTSQKFFRFHVGPQEWREAIIVPTYLHKWQWSRVWHLQGISLLSMVGKIYVRCFVTD